MWKWQGKEIIEAQTRSEKFVCVERFLCFHLICIVFHQATLRILEQIKHDKRIDRKGRIEKLSDNSHRPIAPQQR